MQIKTGKGTIPLVILLAIWSVSAVTSLPGLAVSPILGDLKQTFPRSSDLAIQMLTSLPSLLIIPFVLLSGRLSVARDKSRLLIAGLIIFLASGISYFLARSMTALILISCALGIGAGMVIPLSTGLVVDYFTGRYRIKQLGLSSAINNLTLVLATALTGYLAEINWHMPFLVYMLPAVSLVLAFPLRRDMRSRGVAAPVKQTKSAAPQGAIDKRKLISLMLLYLLLTFGVLVITFYLSFLVDDYDFRHSISGVMISLFFLAIMLPGLFLNKVLELMRENVNLYSLLSIVAGLALIGLVRSQATMIVGCLLAGWGYGVMQPLIYAKTASVAPARLATLALSFVMSVNYLAILICPFVIDMLRSLFATHSDRFPFLFNAALMLALALVARMRRSSFALGLEKRFYNEQ